MGYLGGLLGLGFDAHEHIVRFHQCVQFICGQKYTECITGITGLFTWLPAANGEHRNLCQNSDTAEKQTVFPWMFSLLGTLKLKSCRGIVCVCMFLFHG